METQKTNSDQSIPEGPQYYGGDFIHPTVEGFSVISDQLSSVYKEMIEKQQREYDALPDTAKIRQALPPIYEAIETAKKKLADIEKVLALMDSNKEKFVPGKIEFKYGMGFFGTDYYMVIDDNPYHFVRASEEKSRELAIVKLKELGIEFSGDIIFQWDGTM